jgi:hypothetical protein
VAKASDEEFPLTNKRLIDGLAAGARLANEIVHRRCSEAKPPKVWQRSFDDGLAEVGFWPRHTGVIAERSFFFKGQRNTGGQI